nr:killer cell immunoglobulin-like receptor 3DL1 isoform X1 [Ovis aries]
MSVQKTLSLSPGGARGEVRVQRDLGVHLREHLWPVPSAQGGGGPLAPARWRAVPRGALQAEFPLGPGTPAHSGVYRCYGSFTCSPYSWSDSSDPLFLSVTGSTTSTCPSTMDPHTTEEARPPQGHSSQLHLLLWLSGSFIYTSILLVVLVCHWLPIKCCRHGRRAQGRHNSEWRGGSSQPNPCHSPSPSNGQCSSLGRSHFIPYCTSPSSQDPSAEDVIFVHLNHRTLSEGLFTPTPLSPMPLFTETSIYEEFDVNKEHADPDLAPSFEHTECYKLKS